MGYGNGAAGYLGPQCWWLRVCQPAGFPGIDWVYTTMYLCTVSSKLYKLDGVGRVGTKESI